MYRTLTIGTFFQSINDSISFLLYPINFAKVAIFIHTIQLYVHFRRIFSHI